MEREAGGVGALRRVHEALAHLRSMESPGQMIAQATKELCDTFGFDRAVMFRVADSELVGVSVHIPRDPDWAAELLDITDRVHLPLKHMLFETELLRRRRGMVLHGAPDDPRGFQPLIEAFRTSCYAAVPIMPSGRVIGFLHVDHYYAGRDVDEDELDVLCLYAEGFGFAFERTVLRERVRLQRDHAARLVSAASATMEEIAQAGVELAPGSVDLLGPRTDLPSPVGTDATVGGSRLDTLLTRREIEVLGLMAEGQTNAGIATRLVISEGTVKSHVGHVLRKMRAANRAEAVSRYLRLAQQRPPAA